MNKKVAIILVNYQDYAEKYLDDCLASLRAQDYQGEMKIFVVDNATTAESFTYLSKNIPEAELVLNKTNDGFAKGNNDGIKQALLQNFDYIFCVNLDVVIEPDCVRKMVEAIESYPPLRPSGGGESNSKEIGAVQARIMLWPEKEKINSLGNVTHFLGFGYCEGYGQTHPGFQPPLSRGETKNICYPSGAGVLFKADVLKRVGLFDEIMWMYNEDQDLGWRIWLAGFKCVLAPDAVLYHKYEFSRSITKYYWMDRNRIIAILKNYHWATLLLILPAFLIMEFGLILFSVKSGWFKDKIRVWQYFLTPSTWLYLHRARKQIQVLRKAKDCDIVAMFSGKIWYQEIDDVKLRLVNPIFDAYWYIVKKIIWW